MTRGRRPNVDRSRPPTYESSHATVTRARVSRGWCRVIRRWGVVLLVAQMGLSGTRAEARLPAPGRGGRERPVRGTRDPGQQPPVLRRLAVHATDAASPGDVRRQGGVLHQPGYQGVVPEEVLFRSGAGP